MDAVRLPASGTQHPSIVSLTPRWSDSGNQSDLFGVQAALRLARKRFRIMAGFGLALAVPLFVFLITRPPVYDATSIILINPRAQNIFTNQQNVLGDLPRESAAIESEIEVLRSPDLISRLIDELDLTRNPIWQTSAGEPKSGASEAAKDAGQASELERAAITQDLERMIHVRRRGSTYAIEINARTPEARLSQQLANQFADLYLRSLSETRSATTREANDWISGRLKELSQDVQQKEAAASAYRVSSGLLTNSGSSFTEQQVSSLQSQVLQAQADLAEAQARREQMRQLVDRGQSVDSIGGALNSNVVRDLRERAAEIAQRQSDLENRYLPSHPAVQAIQTEKADIDRRLNAEIARISAGLENDVSIARARTNTMQGALNNMQSRLNSNQVENVRLRELERDAAASRQVYENLLQRYQEIADQDSIKSSDARLIQSASLAQKPASPQKRVAFALAMMAGLMGGLLAGILRELLDNTISGSAELHERLGLRNISSLPDLGRRGLRFWRASDIAPADHVIDQPASAYAESLRVLRNKLMRLARKDQCQIIAVASGIPGEGKTTISLALARIAAMAGQRVIVVDCDLRKRQLTHLIGLAGDNERASASASGPGLVEVLRGTAPLRSAIRRDPRSNVHILANDSDDLVTDEIFERTRMSQLLQALRAQYQWVILDCAPVLAVAETRSLARLADGCLLVARADYSPGASIQSAYEQILEAGGNIYGVALNRLSSSAANRGSIGDALDYKYSKSYHYTA